MLALLKSDINQPKFPPCRKWPICTHKVQMFMWEKDLRRIAGGNDETGAGCLHEKNNSDNATSDNKVDLRVFRCSWLFISRWDKNVISVQRFRIWCLNSEGITKTSSVENICLTRHTNISKYITTRVGQSEESALSTLSAIFRLLVRILTIFDKM